MLNFAVGPVMSEEAVLAIGGEQVPYFRTPEFSKLMLENEAMLLELAGAPKDSRAVFLTGSGTAAMEAVVAGTLSSSDKVLVIDGGSFGHRFVELCQLHEVNHEVLSLPFGKAASAEDLAPYAGTGLTALLVNVCETSSGALHDMDAISAFCKNEGIFLVADAISAFLTDEIDMDRMGIGAMLTGSQKALACPPGVSIVALAPEGIKRAKAAKPWSMYLDLASALSNGERGQTPFTCAVSILRQINVRLRSLIEHGGASAEVRRCGTLAQDFRTRIADLPLTIATNRPSNCVTPLRPSKKNATQIVRIAKDEYDMWLCPNGGTLADEVFRIGHMGALTVADNETLERCLRDLLARNIL